MPDKCVCGADATVSVAELGDALQRAVVAMYPRCPTICTTCFHIILKGPRPAEPTLCVAAEDPPRPPTVPPSPATGQGPGQAPSGSLDNGSTAGSANNNSTEATVEDPDVEFAPLHRQVFATQKLARDAARTVDGLLVSIPGRQNMYTCSCEGCDTKRYVRHDQVAGRWTIKKIGLCEHGTNSSYLEGTSLHLPLPMTLKRCPTTLREGSCTVEAFVCHDDSTMQRICGKRPKMNHPSPAQAPEPSPSTPSALEHAPAQVSEPSPPPSPSLKHASAPVTEPSPSPSPPLEHGPAQVPKPSPSPSHGPSAKSVPKDLHRKASKGDKVCAVFTHHLRTGDKGYLHWGKVLAVEGSECTIKWQTDKKPSSHSIADVFLTEAAAWAAFHSIPSCDSASEAPLYPDSDHEATGPKTSCAQLHR